MKNARNYTLQYHWQSKEKLFTISLIYNSTTNILCIKCFEGNPLSNQMKLWQEYCMIFSLIFITFT